MPRVCEVREVVPDTEYDECEELLENIQNGRNGKSRCGALILKLNDYIKKPSIEHDLSSILNNYRAILHSSDVYIENGIFNTNFAEAALFLQGAVTLHGKQVDLLWDLVIEYLNRNMSYEEKTEANEAEFAKLEERKKKYKRRRKATEELPPDADNSGQVVSFVVDKTSACIQGMNFEEFQEFTAIQEKSKEDATTYERDDYNFDYETNWKERWEKQRNPILERKVRYGLTIPSSTSHEQCLLRHLDSIVLDDKIIPVTHDLTEINMYGEKEPMGDYGSSSSFDRINREFNAQHRQVHTHDIPENQVEYTDVQDFILQKWLVEKGKTAHDVYQHWDEFQADCKFYEDSMYKLKIKVIEENRMICYFDKPVNGPVYDSSTTILPAISPIADDVTGAEEMEVLDLMDKRNVSTRKTMDSDMDSGVFDASSSMTGTTPQPRTLSVHSEGIFDGPLTPKQFSRPPTPFMNETVVVEKIVENCSKRPRRIIKKLEFKDFAMDADEIEMDDDEIEIPIAPKKPRRMKERLRPTTTAALKAFNRFFCMNYAPENGEGALDPIEEDDEEEELGDLPDLNEDMFNLPLGSSTPHRLPSSISANKFCDDLILENCYKTTSNAGPSFADIMGQDAGRRLKHVLDWKKFITEKIGKQQTSDFDIHEEESKVIESVGEIGEVVDFKTICKNKSAATVARNFIAMLHLSNTNNVEILNAQQGKLSNDSLQVKLLSKERHHEQLNEYNAPSETTYKDRLHSVKVALKRDNSNVIEFATTKKRKVLSSIY